MKTVKNYRFLLLNEAVAPIIVSRMLTVPAVASISSAWSLALWMAHILL